MLSATSCILIGELNPFIFKVIIERKWITITILLILFSFCVIPVLFFFSLHAAFLCTVLIFVGVIHFDPSFLFFCITSKRGGIAGFFFFYVWIPTQNLKENKDTGNVPQTEEQGKTPENDPNDMNIYELPNIEFKIIIIRWPMNQAKNHKQSENFNKEKI